MIVISDTSPVNYLVLIGEIDLLHNLYGNIILPQAVRDELTRPEAPEPVRLWAQQPPDWVEIRLAENPKLFPGLGPGETEAISLALALQADFVLIDERKGRRIAAEQGLAVSGTLVVLELAAEQNLIDLPPAIELLKQTSFHITERVLQDVLARDQTRRQQKQISTE